MKDNLIKLSDGDLSVLLRNVKRECDRRTRAAAKDSASIIRGHEFPKRAITIAACGGHSIAFIGVKGSGKTMLRALALDLGVSESFEAWACPCGYINDPRHSCSCTQNQVEKHALKWPVADMMIEVCQVPMREMEGAWPGTSTAQIREAIERAAKSAEWKPDPDTAALLRAAVNELGMEAAEVDLTKRLACTIARLDGESIVRATHLCEAINYRSFHRSWRS